MAVTTGKCKHCGARRELEFRGFLAVLITLLTFGLAYIQVVRGQSEQLLPPWAGVILGSVITFYFMGRSGERMREMTREIFTSNQPEKPAKAAEGRAENNRLET